MTAHGLAASLLVFVLTVSLSRVDAQSTQAPSPAPPKSGVPESIGKRQELQTRFTEAMTRVERDAAAMSPGRSWTWQSDSEQSRELLDALRQDLSALSNTEAAFEASLMPEEKSKAAPQFESIHKMMQHLQEDAQSLDRELQNRYPTRWHVSQDVTDMQKEIRSLRKMHKRILQTAGTPKPR
jgi:hypothetical protein